MLMKNVVVGVVGVLGFLGSLALGDSSFEEHYQNTVLPFYESIPENFINRPGEIELSYKSFEHPFERGAIVIVGGWTETHRKYAELIYDFYQAGYSVYSMDHRGMGFSTRLTQNSQQVHVESVTDYVDDLRVFIEEVVRPETHEKNYIFAHSMGGLVTALYLQKYPGEVHAAVFSAPLFQLNTGIIPEKWAVSLTKAEIKKGKGKEYAITQGDTTFEKASDFKAQKTTHSLARWKKKTENWKQFPILLQGGSTNQWIYSVLEKTRALRENGWKHMPVPAFILQASDDDYVINRGHQTVCAQAKSCSIRQYPKSYHELYLELDAVRTPVLKDVLSFFERY